MAMNVEVNTDAEDAVKQTLEASGHDVVVESQAESKGDAAAPAAGSEEKPADSPAPKGGAAAESKEKAAAVTEDTKKKEETPDPDKQDWNALPEWARDEITKTRRKNRELRDKLEGQQAEQRPPAPAGRTDETKPAATGKEPERTYCGRPKPKLADFTDKEGVDDPYAAFADAAAEWHADEKLAKAQIEGMARAQAEAIRKTMETFNERQGKAAELLPDYDESLEEADDVMASDAMQQVIYTSDVGPFILYHLVKHPEECKRIFEMPPVQAAKAMGRLETKIEAEVAELKGARRSPEPPKRKPADPPPIPETPVRGSESKSKTLREMAGPDDRHVDMIKFNPDYERRRGEQRRG